MATLRQDMVLFGVVLFVFGIQPTGAAETAGTKKEMTGTVGVFEDADGKFLGAYFTTDQDKHYNIVLDAHNGPRFAKGYKGKRLKFMARIVAKPGGGNTAADSANKDKEKTKKKKRKKRKKKRKKKKSKAKTPQSPDDIAAWIKVREKDKFTVLD